MAKGGPRRKGKRPEPEEEPFDEDMEQEDDDEDEQGHGTLGGEVVEFGDGPEEEAKPLTGRRLKREKEMKKKMRSGTFGEKGFPCCGVLGCMLRRGGGTEPALQRTRFGAHLAVPHLGACCCFCHLQSPWGCQRRSSRPSSARATACPRPSSAGPCHSSFRYAL